VNLLLIRRVSVENMNIFAYVNSKFVYVEKYIRTQINYLYRYVLKQRCNLERQVMKNALSLAIHSPDEFAYQIMKGSGYMAFPKKLCTSLNVHQLKSKFGILRSAISNYQYSKKTYLYKKAPRTLLYFFLKPELKLTG